MGDVIDLVEARLQRCLDVLQVRRTADRGLRGRVWEARAYAERELLLSQLIVLKAQYSLSDLSLFEEFALQTIEVNLGLRSKAVWPL